MEKECRMNFKIAEDKKLFWLQNKTWWEVELKPCFPTSNPNKYFSIRDEKGNELSLIENLDNLDDENRSIIENYLSFKNFVFEILGIYTVDEDFGLRHFEVKTSKGDRCFQTPLEDWPEVDEDGTIRINDLYGEQYQIKKLEFGHEILEAYV